MCNRDHLEQTLTAMLDSGTLSESQATGIITECEKHSGKLIKVLADGVKAKAISYQQANAVSASMRALAKAAV